MKQSRVSLELENALWAQGIKHIAGVDEAGRGPLAGPVVAAAVVFPENLIIKNVNDSKKCTAKQREELFPLIQKQALSIGIGIVDHQVIDRINILQATNLAMRKSVENLNIQPEFALIDGNSFKHKTLKFQNIIKGDERSFTIAAASIIAKVTRDRLMRDLDIRFPHYGFAQHKGYGTRKHIEAIRTYGFCEVHRRSFHLSALHENHV
jgi:ribonuclease HII